MTQDTAIARARTPDDSVPGYRLIQLVGRGGMGEVHQAVQLSLGRTVAVKLLRPELASDEQFVGRFEKEAAALATLRHPNIVSIVDRGKSTDSYYLVMEFVDGPSLRERMRDPDFDAKQAMLTMLQVTRAVDYAHNRGVIHRDLKPENILFDEQAGQLPKVTDFGLAGFDERHSDTPRHLTQTHVSMGTAAYMAPEQAVDARSAGPKADLFSLGVMFYELLTGELPMGTFEMPSVKKPGLDKRLDAIIARCLKPAPEDRYPSAAALLADLEPLVGYTSLPSLMKQTRFQRLLFRAREVSVRVGRWVAAGVVLFALAIVGAAFSRARVSAVRQPSGVELMTDFGVRAPLSTPGRLDRGARQLSVGTGPDTISVMALGRAAQLKDGALVYEAPKDLPAGRAVLDAEVPGNGLEVSAVVDTQAVPASRLEPVLAIFRGPRPDARSALMLEGEHGRYVALVVSGSGSEPTLEWNLGPDKRGVMQAPLPISATSQRLALRIDAEAGTLFAIVGEGRDARVLGDGVWLGPQWRALLGDATRPAVGCLEGTCAFRDLSMRGLEVPALTTPAFPPDEAPLEDGSGWHKLSDRPPPVHKPARPPPAPPTPKAEKSEKNDKPPAKSAPPPVPVKKPEKAEKPPEKADPKVPKKK